MYHDIEIHERMAGQGVYASYKYSPKLLSLSFPFLVKDSY